LPQSASSSPTWHVFAAQQPVHELESHRHAPATQRVPAAHAGPAPQWHAPPLQLLPVCPQLVHWAPAEPQVRVSTAVMQPAPALQQPLQVLGSHWHAPASQSSPAPHLGPEPQRQPPST
jgi:hypothetical protein